jgi:hypothetical protein
MAVTLSSFPKIIKFRVLEKNILQKILGSKTEEMTVH